MCDEDDIDDWASEPDGPFEPDPAPSEFAAIDPEDDDEAEPAPGDFWFESDDPGDE